MNKQSKKKLELQLHTAIEGILLKLDSGAAAKSRKTIKQASKAVVKKFNKAVKATEEKKETEKQKKIKSKKKILTGKSEIKKITGETARVRRSYAKEPLAPLAPPAETPETVTATDSGSETRGL